MADHGMIYLSMHDDYIHIESDGDSSMDPEQWITVYGLGETQDLHFDMSYEETAELRDRLNHLLERYDEIQAASG